MNRFRIYPEMCGRLLSTKLYVPLFLTNSEYSFTEWQLSKFILDYLCIPFSRKHHIKRQLVEITKFTTSLIWMTLLVTGNLWNVILFVSFGELYHADPLRMFIYIPVPTCINHKGYISFGYNVNRLISYFDCRFDNYKDIINIDV